MFVSDILAQKGGLVFSVSPGTSVADVARQLTTRRIGAVLVLDGEGDGAVLGIVSERDLVRALAAHGGKALELDVRQVMTRERFRHLPVVRSGELLGLISIGDVVKARIEETRHETEALKAYIIAG